MIDNPEQVDRLLGRLQKNLPFDAGLTPRLAETIRKQAPHSPVPRKCQVTWISYGGDEAGIVCKLDLGDERGSLVFFASITHLIVRPDMPLARDIAAYQKHRIKRLRRA